MEINDKLIREVEESIFNSMAKCFQAYSSFQQSRVIDNLWMAENHGRIAKTKYTTFKLLGIKIINDKVFDNYAELEKILEKISVEYDKIRWCTI